jgi:hypothetical protein
MQQKSGPAARLARHFNVAPSHPVVPARADGFHPSLFRSKASGIALYPVRLRLAVLNLSLSENPVKKPLTMPLDRFANAMHFGNVNSRTDDHAGTLAQRLQRGRPGPERLMF